MSAKEEADMKKKLEEKAQLQSNKGMLQNSNNPYH